MFSHVAPKVLLRYCSHWHTEESKTKVRKIIFLIFFYIRFWKKLWCSRLVFINFCSSGIINALPRYERQLEGPNESRKKVTKEPYQLTRSKTSPFDKNSCFFCEEPESEKQTLHMVSTFSAGKSLNEAIRLSGNDVLHVKLISATLNANYGLSIDIKYHKTCWLRNVSNVLRGKQSSAEETTLDFILARQQQELSFLQLRRLLWGMGRFLPCLTFRVQWKKHWLKMKHRKLPVVGKS